MPEESTVQQMILALGIVVDLLRRRCTDREERTAAMDAALILRDAIEELQALQTLRQHPYGFDCDWDA